MPLSFFGKLFLHQEAQTSIILLIVQQALVGFSIYLSVEVSQKIAKQQVDSFDLFMLIAAYIAPFFPGILSNYMGRLWFLRVIKTFWQKENENIGNTYTEEASSVYISQGKDVYGQIVNFFHSALSITLNFLVGIVIVGIVLDGSIMVAFIISFFLVLSLYLYYRNYIIKKANEHSKASANMVTILGKALDNLSSGNGYNASSWQEVRDLRLETYENNYKAYEGTRSLLIFVTTLASFGPVALTLIWDVFTGTDQAHLIALIINLPRIFQIVNASTELVQVILELFSILGAAQIFRAFETRNTIDLINYVDINKIDINKIDINKQHFIDINAAISNLSGNRSGFFEVKGPNGSGKTSLLRKLQNGLKNSYYFSPRNRLFWPIKIESGLSDGEYSLLVLNWLLENADGPLLLDEWDAFLSSKSRQYIRDKILKKSKDITIITVSHRTQIRHTEKQ